MTEQGTVQVECYSGHTYAQEPRALVWEGQRYRVIDVEQRWRTPDGPGFWIRTESGKRFELIYHEVQNHWLIQILVGIDRKGARQAKILPFPAPSCGRGGSKTKDKEVHD